MKNVPTFIIEEINRLILVEDYRTLYDLYTGDVVWINDGTYYLSGNYLKLANWFNENTILFEQEFLNRIKKRA